MLHWCHGSHMYICVPYWGFLLWAIMMRCPNMSGTPTLASILLKLSWLYYPLSLILNYSSYSYSWSIASIRTFLVHFLPRFALFLASSHFYVKLMNVVLFVFFSTWLLQQVFFQNWSHLDSNTVKKACHERHMAHVVNANYEAFPWWQTYGSWVADSLWCHIRHSII